MSRIGKHPVLVPAGVNVTVDGQTVAAKGKLGQLSVTLDSEISVAMENNQVVVKPRDKSRNGRMKWGLSRSLVANLVKGVSDGYEINLEITGVGFRAAVQGKELVMQLGFSHDVKFAIPDGITIKCEKPTSVSVFGADKQAVGQLAAKIRGMKPPEPYKGKGVAYAGEYILRKEGKKK